jgi:hypothetical protein
LNWCNDFSGSPGSSLTLTDSVTGNEFEKNRRGFDELACELGTSGVCCAHLPSLGSSAADRSNFSEYFHYRFVAGAFPSVFQFSPMELLAAFST